MYALRNLRQFPFYWTYLSKHLVMISVGTTTESFIQGLQELIAYRLDLLEAQGKFPKDRSQVGGVLRTGWGYKFVEYAERREYSPERKFLSNFF